MRLIEPRSGGAGASAKATPESGRDLPSIQQVVEVEYRYVVHFTRDPFDSRNPLLERTIAQSSQDLPQKGLFVIDREVARHHPYLVPAIQNYCHDHRDSLTLVCPPLVVDGGEPVKNDPAQVTAIQEAIHRYGVDRHSYVIAVGSGALLDMAGYATATAHRGIRLIRVPTTILSQADSGVGVKNGINAFGKKNFLGTFAPPHAVLNDFTLLTTLPDREWRSGIAEAVKVALLKDAEFFQFIEQHAEELIARDEAAMRWVIYRCARLHLDDIARGGDPFEFGSSRPLDFGHWAAHKLEQLSDYRIRHGEAVAIGLALDSPYSYLTGLLREHAWRRILSLLGRLELAITAPEMRRHLDDRVDSGCLLHGLNEFRERLGGQLTIMLLRRIGLGMEVHEMDEDLIIRSVALLEEIQAASPQGGTYGAHPSRPLTAHATATHR